MSNNQAVPVSSVQQAINKPNGAIAPVQPTIEQLQDRIRQLEAQQARQVTSRVTFRLSTVKQGVLMACGLGRFPWSGYYSQWTALAAAMADMGCNMQPFQGHLDSLLAEGKLNIKVK